MLDMESLLFGAKNMERERALAIAMRTPDRDDLRRCGNGWTLDQQACNLAAGLKLLDYPVYLGLWKREKGYHFLYR